MMILYIAFAQMTEPTHTRLRVNWNLRGPSINVSHILLTARLFFSLLAHKNGQIKMNKNVMIFTIVQFNTVRDGPIHTHASA